MSQLTRNDLITNNDNSFNANGARGISGPSLNSYIVDVIDSFVNISDDVSADPDFTVDPNKFATRSIIRDFVVSEAGMGLGAGSGLTENAGNSDLGGALTTPAILTAVNQGFVINDSEVNGNAGRSAITGQGAAFTAALPVALQGSSPYIGAQVIEGDVYVGWLAGDSGVRYGQLAYIDISGPISYSFGVSGPGPQEGLNMQMINGGTAAAISIAPTGALSFVSSGISTITDAMANGFQYAADYSGNNAANPRWIPDKAYVDAASAGGWATTGNTNLTGDVTITNGLNNFLMTSVATDPKGIIFQQTTAPIVLDFGLKTDGDFPRFEISGTDGGANNTSWRYDAAGVQSSMAGAGGTNSYFFANSGFTHTVNNGNFVVTSANEVNLTSGAAMNLTTGALGLLVDINGTQRVALTENLTLDLVTSGAINMSSTAGSQFSITSAGFGAGDGGVVTSQIVLPGAGPFPPNYGLQAVATNDSTDPVNPSATNTLLCSTFSGSSMTMEKDNRNLFIGTGAMKAVMSGNDASISGGGAGVQIGYTLGAEANGEPLRGLRYFGFGEATEDDPTGADYSSLVGTALVPKAYVDANIAGISTDRGISNDAGTIVLGGPFSDDIVLTGDDKNFTLDIQDEGTSALKMGVSSGGGDNDTFVRILDRDLRIVLDNDGDQTSFTMDTGDGIKFTDDEGNGFSVFTDGGDLVLETDSNGLIDLQSDGNINMDASGGFTVQSTGAADFDLGRVNGGQNQTFVMGAAGITLSHVQGGETASIVLAQNSITVTGSGANFPGILYAADYSADFSARSLVDKAYVDSVAGGGLGAGSGLTENGGNIDLGGALTSNVNLTRDSAAPTVFNIGLDDTANNTTTLYSQVSGLGSATLSLTATDTATSFAGHVEASNQRALLRFTGTGAAENFVRITSAQIEIQDAVNSKGAVYVADYSANFTDRSLVDKGFTNAQRIRLTENTAGGTVSAGIRHVYITAAGSKTLRPITEIGDYMYVSNITGAQVQLTAAVGQDFIGASGGNINSNPIPSNETYLLMAISATRWLMIDGMSPKSLA